MTSNDQAKCRPALEMIINQYTQYTFSEQKFIRNEVALGFLGFLQLPGFLSPKSKGRRFRGGMPIAECHRISSNVIWIYHIFKIYKNLYLYRPNQWAHSVHMGPIVYQYPLQTLAKASPHLRWKPNAQRARTRWTRRICGKGVLAVQLTPLTEMTICIATLNGMKTENSRYF